MCAILLNNGVSKITKVNEILKNNEILTGNEIMPETRTIKKNGATLHNEILKNNGFYELVKFESYRK